ncbi:MAG TPA: Gfo/Idh/MocA family oxidoreductase [Gemmatimonadales bacterium]|nr:Gfo/Idh/MocA family oxidoreductase [Gemmatimonadales bacterium]
MGAKGSALRLVVVGCGRVFERFHHPALLNSSAWELVGAVDTRPARLHWVASVQPDLPVAESLGALPDSAAFDAVLIATPPESHCPLGAEVLRRGAHLLIEKPLALQAGEAASLLAVAERAGRQVWVGFNRRFRPGYGELRRRLQGVPPERIRGLDFDLHTDPRRWDAITRHADDPEGRGGLIDDLASHQLDLVPWLLQRPVEAARARYLRREPGATVVEIGLRFAGGTEARCRAGHGTLQLERITVDLGDRMLVASAGGLVATSPALAPLVGRRLAAKALADAVRRRITRLPKATVDTIRRQHADWAAALHGAEPPVGAAADGLAGARCVALTDAARHSLAGGGAWVPVSPHGAQ